jgi:hypothetical protein
MKDLISIISLSLIFGIVFSIAPDSAENKDSGNNWSLTGPTYVINALTN